MFYIQYEVQPSPQHEDYAEVGGAYANCFVLADSVAKAEARALRNFAENHWQVVAVQEPASPTVRTDSSDKEWLECYDEANEKGECYAYFQWPHEAQDDDAVH